MVAAGLLALSGLFLTLVAAAQARDRRGRMPGDVRRTVLITLGIVAVAVWLTATVLPSTVAWALVAASVSIILIITLAD